MRKFGFEVFDDWFAAGPEADDYWQKYEQSRGRTYDQALKGQAAQHVFGFDLKHLNESDAAVLLAPGGKSAHLELGYMVGRGKPGYVLFETPPERFDVMLNFATGVFFDANELIEVLLEHGN